MTLAKITVCLYFCVLHKIFCHLFCIVSIIIAGTSPVKTRYSSAISNNNSSSKSAKKGYISEISNKKNLWLTESTSSEAPCSTTKLASPLSSPSFSSHEASPPFTTTITICSFLPTTTISPSSSISTVSPCKMSVLTPAYSSSITSVPHTPDITPFNCSNDVLFTTISSKTPFTKPSTTKTNGVSCSTKASATHSDKPNESTARINVSSSKTPLAKTTSAKPSSIKTSSIKVPTIKTNVLFTKTPTTQPPTTKARSAKANAIISTSLYSTAIIPATGTSAVTPISSQQQQHKVEDTISTKSSHQVQSNLTRTMPSHMSTVIIGDTSLCYESIYTFPKKSTQHTGNVMEQLVIEPESWFSMTNDYQENNKSISM